jgi:hypothetical protein
MRPYLLGGAVSGALITGAIATFLTMTALVGDTAFPGGSAMDPFSSGTATVTPDTRAGSPGPAQAPGPVGPLAATPRGGSGASVVGNRGAGGSAASASGDPASDRSSGNASAGGGGGPSSDPSAGSGGGTGGPPAPPAPNEVPQPARHRSRIRVGCHRDQAGRHSARQGPRATRPRV